MKQKVANLCWLGLLIVFVAAIVYAARPPRVDEKAKATLAATRQRLHQEGYKIELSDFKYSAPPETRARADAVIAAFHYPRIRQELPAFNTVAGSNRMVVDWKSDSFKGFRRPRGEQGETISWDDLRATVSKDQLELDGACSAILSGPIAFDFDPSDRFGTSQRHLAAIQHTVQMFNTRMLIALHDGDRDVAFRNLLAMTRLVTAWQVEPMELSHLFQSGYAKHALNLTWQAFQTNGWTDEQLMRLQHEWESVDFFTNLPDVVALQNISSAARYEKDREDVLKRPPFSAFFRETWAVPLVAGDFRYQWQQSHYQRQGSYLDENKLLLFYRDRELEVRQALQATNWIQMRAVSGMTNEVYFNAEDSTTSTRNFQHISSRFRGEAGTPFGGAAEAEASRRMIITAIALERYHNRYGKYPQSLAVLAPEFLKTVPVDFMDGQPLRYRPAGTHFVLYSVGLDCIDNGGQIQLHRNDEGYLRLQSPWDPLPDSDIVWPLPATETL